MTAAVKIAACLLLLPQALLLPRALLAEDPAQAWAEVLERPVSFEARRESFEAALHRLARQVNSELPEGSVNVAVKILSTDLAREGYTRNQQFRDFAADNQPLRTVLTQLVASVDMGAPEGADASHPGQKIVWVVGSDPSDMGQQLILITTREMAAKRNYSLPQELVEPNSLSQAEQQAGFELLFDGHSLEGWKHNGNWTVADRALARSGPGGNLVYDKAKVPDNFELRFQWKVAEGSNSGVYYRPGQYEYQILDNQKHADGKNPRTSAASLYFCMAPSHDATRAPGQWNEGRIVCQGTVIQHWLNGQKVIDFDYADPQWAANVELLARRGGKLAQRGAHLSLQDHGDPVWYRSLRWRQRGNDEELERSDVQPAEVSGEVLRAEQQKLQRIEASRKKM